jgi:hypothetical protein
MDELDLLAALLEKLPPDPQARMRYVLFAGGLVWSDETPAWDFDGLAADQFPPGHGHFRALLNFRSSLILDEPAERFRGLWERALSLCPNWPGFLASRRDPALAETCRARSAASIRSWEEIDVRYEQQRQAKASKAPA